MKPYHTKINFGMTVMLWAGCSVDGVHFRLFEHGQTMDSDRYIQTIEWYHEKLKSDGFRFVSFYVLSPNSSETNEPFSLKLWGYKQYNLSLCKGYFLTSG